MSAEVDRKALLAALGLVQGSVETRTTTPILSCVKVQAEDGVLTLSATDLRQWATVSIDCDGAIAPFCVRADRLHDSIATMTAETVSIVASDSSIESIELQGDRSRRELATLPSEDFPDLADAMDSAVSVEMAADELAERLSLCVDFVSTEETSYYLNGVFLHDDGWRLAFVATDRHRLALTRSDVEAGGWPDCIVPTAAIRSIVAMASGGGRVVLSATDRLIRAQFERAGLTVKPIEGSYPDYRRVIPPPGEARLTVSADLLARAAKGAASVSDDRTAKIALSLGKDAMRVLGGGDDGLAVEELLGEYEGREIEIGFNSRYLTSICSKFGDEAVDFYFSDPARPALILPREREDVKIVLMPMRI